MTSTCSVRQFNDTTVILSSSISEDLLKEVVNKANEGYTIVDGTSQMHRIRFQVCMEKVSEEAVVEDAVEDEIVADQKEEDEPAPDVLDEGDSEVTKSEKPSIDYEVIKTFDGNKETLENYARDTFDVELKRSRSFKNMIKDLEAALTE